MKAPARSICRIPHPSKPLCTEPCPKRGGLEHPSNAEAAARRGAVSGGPDATHERARRRRRSARLLHPFRLPASDPRMESPRAGSPFAIGHARSAAEQLMIGENSRAGLLESSYLLENATAAGPPSTQPACQKLASREPDENGARAVAARARRPRRRRASNARHGRHPPASEAARAASLAARDAVVATSRRLRRGANVDNKNLPPAIDIKRKQGH